MAASRKGERMPYEKAISSDKAAVFPDSRTVSRQTGYPILLKKRES